MTIGLTYDQTLSRVQIALSGLNDAVSSVHVERSFNQLLWSTVRGGTELPVTSGAGSLDDFEFAADVENFYRVTTVDPPPGLLLDGTSGDYASTPDDASLDITGDIDLRSEASLDDWSVVQNLVAKYETTGDNRSYRLLTSSQLLRLEWSPDGTIASRLDAESTETVPAEPGERLAVRATLDVDDGAGGWIVTFYTAPSIDGPWTQLGAAVDNSGGGTTSIFAGTATLNVGAALNDGSSNPAAGVIHAAEVRDGIDGTEVADPDFTAEPSGTTNFTDDAGRAWTVNGAAEIVTSETGASITPAFDDCEVWLKSIRYPLLNRQVTIGDYSDLERPGRTGVLPVTGRSFPIGTTDVSTSLRFGMDFMTETPEQARELKLLVALGDILFLHVPADGNPQLPPRSMYLVSDSSAVGRLGIRERRRTTVPFTEVAAPSPLVVGTTLTWGNVFATFGDWEQLISATPTWGDLLATVGSEDDLVVL